MQRRTGLVILTRVMLMFAAYLFSLPPIPQSASYHNFADQRVATRFRFFGGPQLPGPLSSPIRNLVFFEPLSGNLLEG
jgi:hypothetical protein